MADKAQGNLSASIFLDERNVSRQIKRQQWKRKVTKVKNI